MAIIRNDSQQLRAFIKLLPDMCRNIFTMIKFWINDIQITINVVISF